MRGQRTGALNSRGIGDDDANCRGGAGTLLLGVGAVVAQQDAVKEAQDTDEGNGKNMGAC